MADQNRCDNGWAALACGQQALVVFEDRADSKPLRLLRPGYRHCFCLVGNGLAWTVCDPLKTRIELTPVFGVSRQDLAAMLATPDRTILVGEACAERRPRPMRLRVASCVEVVKRVLNIDAAAVVTPYQLCLALLNPTPPGRPFVRYQQPRIGLDSVS